MDENSNTSRPSEKYYRQTAGGGLEGPFGETEAWWEGRVRFWLVDQDGKARIGEYCPEQGIRETA